MSQAQALPRLELEEHLKRPITLDKDLIKYKPVQIALGLTLVFNLWSFAVEEFLLMWMLLKIVPNIITFGLTYTMMHLGTVILSCFSFYKL